MNTIKFNHPTCRHGEFIDWCNKCKSKKKVRRIARRANGQFAYSARAKVYNAISIAIGVSLIVVSGFFHLSAIPAQAEFVSPESSLAMPGYGMLPTATPTPTTDPIKQEIKEVFGEYADEALKIVECESKFNPKAYHVNANGYGVDRGLFQINSKYHVADKKFLYDYKVNTAMAYKIFKDAGYSWKPWACRSVLNK